MSYIMRCFAAAKGKMTTYVAAVTALVATIPDFVGAQWVQLEHEFTWLQPYHHKVVVVGILASIWTRIRREVSAKPDA